MTNLDGFTPGPDVMRSEDTESEMGIGRAFNEEPGDPFDEKEGRIVAEFCPLNEW